MIFRRKKIKRTLGRKIGNTIIGFFILLFILLGIAFAFSQTSTFRKILKDEIVSIANKSLNGKLEIESLEGTLFTYIKLNNVLLRTTTDTLLQAKKIEVAINPFLILLKKINITKFNIQDADLSVLEEAPAKWNINNLIKINKTDLHENTVTTKKTKDDIFPFEIDISELSLKRVSFKLKKYKYLNTHTLYSTMNYNDIEIYDLNLKINILVNIAEKVLALNISELSFKPNIDNFILHNLSSQIYLTKDFAEVKNFSFLTDSTMLNLSAKIEDFNLFGNINMAQMKNSSIAFDLTANPICANDLSAFLGSLKFMRGRAALSLNGKGKYGDFNFASIFKYKNTSLNFNGNLSKLDTPAKLYIKAEFTNSHIVYNDVDSFLKGLNLPKYPKLIAKNVNLKFDGEPLVFNSSGSAEIDNGRFNFTAFMDITKNPIEYDYTVNTQNLDLNSTLNIPTKLNAHGHLTGNGFDPNRSNSTLAFDIINSKFSGHQIDSTKIKLETIDKLVALDIYSIIDSMKNKIEGKLDLANAEKPIYNLTGKFDNLNLFKFINDSTFNSNLNFTFDINGQSLDLDETEGDFKLNFANSIIGSNKFDSLKFIIALSKEDDFRLINFQSDLLDFNVSGNFKLAETIDLLAYQTKKIGYAISQKLNEVNPLQFSSDTSNTLQYLKKNNYLTENNIYLDFDFDFKDFKLIAALLNRDKVEISGKGFGFLENDADNFTISTNMNIDWLFLYKGKDVFYISDVINKFDFGVDNKKFTFDNIFGSITFNSNKMVSPIDINEIKADLVFNQSKAFINAEANINNQFKTGIEGFLTFSDTTALFNISNLFLSYRDYNWSNRDSIQIVNTQSSFDIQNFNLYNGDAKINLFGSIINKRNLNFELSLHDLDGGTLINKLLNYDVSTTSSKINLLASIKGTTRKPIYLLNMKMEDFNIRNNYIGSLFCNLSYKNQNINTDIKFIDEHKTPEHKLFSLEGNIPINLDINNSDAQIDSSKKLNLKFEADKFNLASFGNAIPTVKKQNGYIDANIILSGKLNDFDYSGYLKSNNIKFTSTLNNLRYSTKINLLFNRKEVTLAKSYLKNIEGTNFPGKLNFTGKMLLNGFNVNYTNVTMQGSLALYAPLSREVSPNFYGDLFVKTDPHWIFKYEKNKPSFSGTILLDEVNLNYVPSESSYSITGSDFKYVFVDDTNSTNLQKLKKSKLRSALTLKAKKEESKTITTNFDLDIIIKSPKISKLSVLLSKALNQKLIADITGELRIKNIGDKLFSQGQFDILPSSMFTFYKTFNAEGNIKFTSDITNPLLNITATYTADYLNPRDKNAEPVKTAVKIKIDDSVNSLLKNLASGEKQLDMKIYSGQQNIEYNVPNPQYSNLDAMYFVLFGTFSTDTENAQLAKSAGYSMLGSAFTSVLNAKLGNFVNNVNINQSGDQTRFNISGRYQKVRYSVGGTVEEISDWSQASAKIEYLFSPRFIMRVERKDPVISSSYNTRKINEFGVMYRFSF